jgi:CRP-like cAMP-binding protein
MQSLFKPRLCARGETIWATGTSGLLWQVCAGTVALEYPTASGPQLAQVAFAGDLIGTESLLGLPCEFQARAITECRLEVAEARDEAAHNQLLASRDMTALRTGSVADRLRFLLQRLGCDEQAFLLLSPAARDEVRRSLPGLVDLSRVIDAQKETVCRALGHILPRSKSVPRSPHAFPPPFVHFTAAGCDTPSFRA